jgi:hypothetical protein
MESDTLFHNPKKLRRIVGYLAFVLPISLFVIGVMSPQVCRYKTISDYYFSPLGGDLLVGILFFMGFFLISYKGQSDYGDSAKWDNILSTVAGVAAVGIAIFPVEGYSCHVGSMVRAYVDMEEVCHGSECGKGSAVKFVMFRYAGALHSISTLTFFLSLAGIAFFMFTRSDSSNMSAAKKQRNVIYRATAFTIVGVMLAMGVRKFFLDGELAQTWDGHAISFWLETLGLYAFGFAWWVKGEGLSWVND